MAAWWAECVDGYLRSLSRRNRRPNTLRTYGAELREFAAYLERHVVIEAGHLDSTHIEGWQDELRQRRGVKTQLVAAAALRGALRWGGAHEVLNSSLWLRVVSPSVPEGLPRPLPKLDLELLQRFLDQPSHDDLWQLRTRALFWVILSSGARISEALSLGRYALKEGSAPIIQKGGRPHLLVVSEKAQQAVQDYERSRRDPSTALFVSLHGAQLQVADRPEIQEAWDRLCLCAGVTRFTSHQLRHSCATTLRRNGADIVLIAQHLGHRGLDYVRNYTLIDIDERRQAMRLFDISVAI